MYYSLLNPFSNHFMPISSFIQINVVALLSLLTKEVKMSIDSYRLTSLDEPTDAMLQQIMSEAAADARQKGEAAHKRYFDQLRRDAIEKSSLWFKENPEYASAQ